MSKSMSSLADFLAKTSAQPDAAQAYQEAVVDCGLNTTVSSTKSNRSSRSSKTSPPFDLEDWTKCSGHLLRSGTMQNGIVSPLPPLVLLTAGTASGSWPTPRATDYKNGKGKTGNRSVQNAYKAGWTLPEKVLMWPTPSASDNRDRGHMGMPAIQRRMEKGKQLNLSMVVSEISGALNPTWVEWLMGFPAEWTACAGLETRLSRKSQK